MTARYRHLVIFRRKIVSRGGGSRYILKLRFKTRTDAYSESVIDRLSTKVCSPFYAQASCQQKFAVHFTLRQAVNKSLQHILCSGTLPSSRVIFRRKIVRLLSPPKHREVPVLDTLQIPLGGIWSTRTDACSNLSQVEVTFGSNA